VAKKTEPLKISKHIGRHINALCRLWIRWLICHEEAMVGNDKMAVNCERLILKRYELIEKIDEEFEKWLAKK